MIEIKGLNKNFGALRVLRDVDLDVERGECYGLLGPNGAGKTTLINLICGLLMPGSGSIALGEREVCEAPGFAGGLGLAPQEMALFAGLTGFENLRFFARINDIEASAAADIARSLLAKVGLSEHADRRAGIYSQGMKQRLNIAAALVNAPELVLLDEPTAGLDPLARIAIWELIEGMKSDGTTVVMATHNLEEADRLCDRVAILSAGSVRAVGNPRELTEAHRAATFEECFMSILGADA